MYFILTKPAKGMNAEVVDYWARIRSGRTYRDVDTATNAAIAAIEQIELGSF